jgi:hypothetical protein
MAIDPVYPIYTHPLIMIQRDFVFQAVMQRDFEECNSLRYWMVLDHSPKDAVDC